MGLYEFGIRRLVFIYIGMDLKEALLREHSKRQTQSISDFIGNHQSRFDALMQIFFTEDYRVVQRAAWVLSYSAMAHPILV